MGLEQRLAILELARSVGAWVIEDDFDGEYTFRGQPLPAMQGLADPSHVVYVGTFAKTLFPALRLGFMVLPPDLAERCKTALSLTGQFAPLVLQAALADFIAGGYFFRHLNRMRRLYARRRAHFLGLFEEHLGEWCDPLDGHTGIQIASVFRFPVDDCAVAERASSSGINVAPLSRYFVEQTAVHGLLMGYAGVTEAGMSRPFLTLREIVRETAFGLQAQCASGRETRSA
jgi:GntR family transcriptional regulator/MocR family aminotransferase